MYAMRRGIMKYGDDVTNYKFLSYGPWQAPSSFALGVLVSHMPIVRLRQKVSVDQFSLPRIPYSDPRVDGEVEARIFIARNSCLNNPATTDGDHYGYKGYNFDALLRSQARAS